MASQFREVSFFGLPVEIQAHIISFIDSRLIQPVLLTCKHLHAIALPLTVKHVYIGSGMNSFNDDGLSHEISALYRFLRTITVLNPELASYVQSLEFGGDLCDSLYEFREGTEDLRLPTPTPQDMEVYRKLVRMICARETDRQGAAKLRRRWVAELQKGMAASAMALILFSCPNLQRFGVPLADTHTLGDYLFLAVPEERRPFPFDEGVFTDTEPRTMVYENEVGDGWVEWAVDSPILFPPSPPFVDPYRQYEAADGDSDANDEVAVPGVAPLSKLKEVHCGIRRPVKDREPYLHGHAHWHLFQALLKIPSVRRFEFSYEKVSAGKWQNFFGAWMPERSSSVEHIFIAGACPHSQGMVPLIRSCQALKSFQYCLKQDVDWTAFPRDLADALTSQSDTLEYIDARFDTLWDAGHWRGRPEKVYFGTSLSQLTALKHLRASMQQLTGQLHYPSNVDDSRGTWSIEGAPTLAEVLPDNIEYLEVLDCDLGSEFMMQLEEMAAIAQEGQRWTKLKKVVLQFPWDIGASSLDLPMPEAPFVIEVHDWEDLPFILTDGSSNMFYEEKKHWTKRSDPAVNDDEEFGGD